ncbi:hypothetical protein BaRGS_00000624 [Batillaria attramentaria]|uniref:Uncharacterized protein n=1 Tax=Batillaria attramentaria TaxID=370345 RepID=A0ABD0M8Y5_9CAEN
MHRTPAGPSDNGQSSVDFPLRPQRGQITDPNQPVPKFQSTDFPPLIQAEPGTTHSGPRASQTSVWGQNTCGDSSLDPVQAIRMLAQILKSVS